MEKLEGLLNRLIERGWRIENPNARISDVKYMYGLRELRIVYETDRRDAVRQYPIRFLVSKESGLWQFVCENGMIKGMLVDIDGSAYKYYITESALIDESELEEFLLSNIKL